VDFAEADLTLANCTFTDFTNSRFQHTNLTQADFTGATNYTIAPNLNTLKKTKFSLPEAMALLYGLDIVLTEYQA
jgi:fluoroquinolone resistance protein